MKKTKFAQLLSMKPEELASEVKEARKALMLARVSRADLEASQNSRSRSHSIRSSKKKIARALTALRVLKKR